MRLFITALLLVCLVIAAPAAKAQSNLIDLELVIAVDVSGSVDDDEAALQRQGYIKAFRDPKIIEAITQGQMGAIAVTYFECASSHH